MSRILLVCLGVNSLLNAVVQAGSIHARSHISQIAPNPVDVSLGMRSKRQKILRSMV